MSRSFGEHPHDEDGYLNEHGVADCSAERDPGWLRIIEGGYVSSDEDLRHDREEDTRQELGIGEMGNSSHITKTSLAAAREITSPLDSSSSEWAKYRAKSSDIDLKSPSHALKSGRDEMEEQDLQHETNVEVLHCRVGDELKQEKHWIQQTRKKESDACVGNPGWNVVAEKSELEESGEMWSGRRSIGGEGVHVHSTIGSDFAHYYSEGGDISYIVDPDHNNMSGRHFAESSNVQEQEDTGDYFCHNDQNRRVCSSAGAAPIATLPPSLPLPHSNPFENELEGLLLEFGEEGQSLSAPTIPPQHSQNPFSNPHYTHPPLPALSAIAPTPSRSHLTHCRDSLFPAIGDLHQLNCVYVPHTALSDVCDRNKQHGNAVAEREGQRCTALTLRKQEAEMETRNTFLQQVHDYKIAIEIFLATELPFLS